MNGSTQYRVLSVGIFNCWFPFNSCLEKRIGYETGNIRERLGHATQLAGRRTVREMYEAVLIYSRHKTAEYLTCCW